MRQSTVKGFVCLEQSPALWPRVSGDAGLLRMNYQYTHGLIWTVMVNLGRREKTQKSPNMIDYDQCHADIAYDDSIPSVKCFDAT
ncbi:hypothetical protein WN51_00575 [Melipona quadrifasciata]|uniref:Uncharacterized protein n=1 Tax=Melipona quadrifasciata TaxID=166423 RepID=A0A0M8ZZW3_9HYME|nr:hypothetical protein WN51_00575 [Melipona quadrifasciata]